MREFDGRGGSVLPSEPQPTRGEKPVGDPHLRSVKEVCGYSIAATDGEIGRIYDVILDDASWRLHYVVVDTGNWLPGRKVLFSIDWVESFDFLNRTAVVNVTKARVEGSPEFDPSAPVNRQYEELLYDYGRPAHWVGTVEEGQLFGSDGVKK